VVPPERQETGGGSGRGFSRAVREAAPYLGLGTTLAVTVLAGLGGGYWLDGRLGTRPLFLILGGVLGTGAALYHFFKTVTKEDKQRAGPKR
jgi:F0F1-type ATP synthase assembly protein I